MGTIKELFNFEKKTLLLYVALIVFATAFACLSQTKPLKKIINGEVLVCRKFNTLPFVMSFFVLAFFAATTANGTDRPVYGNMFQSITWDNIGNGQEPGFNIFMLIVKIFTNNPAVFCAIMQIITVVCMYKGFYDLRDNIYIGFAVFIYASQYYVQSYNLMRMYFALSITFAGIKLLKDKKYFSYFIVLLVATLMHYSTIFAVVAYLLGMIYIKLKHWSLGVHTLWSVVLAAGMFFFILYGVDIIKGINFPIINKYLVYLENININSIGLMWLFRLIPIASVIYLAKKFNDEYNFRKIALAFLIVITLINVLSYSVPVLGRATKMLSFIYIVYYPYITELYRKSGVIERLNIDCGQKGIKVFGMNANSVFYILIVFGLVYNLYLSILYFSGYRLSDGIDNFRFIWENYLW